MAEPKRELPWLVIICREGISEVTVFTEENEARSHFEKMSWRWSDSFLARAVIAPRDWVGTP
jgi:hypothetical protein